MHTAAQALVEAGGAGKNLCHCTVEQEMHTQILNAATLETLLCNLKSLAAPELLHNLGELLVGKNLN